MKLCDSEWKIMEYLWKEGPLTTMQIYKMAGESEGWSKSTVITFLNRMDSKGSVRYEQKGNSKLYYPLISKEEAELEQTKSFLERFYDGKVGLLINNLVRQEELSKEDLDEIHKIIKDGE